MKETSPIKVNPSLSLLAAIWLLTLLLYLHLRPRLITATATENGQYSLQVRPDPSRHATLIVSSEDEIDRYRLEGHAWSQPFGMKRFSLEVPPGWKSRLVQIRTHSLPTARFADTTTGWLHALPLALASSLLLYFIALRLAGATFAKLFGIGALMRLLYACATPWSVRAWDSGGHAEYVRRLVNDLALPHAGACWECYHPPFYYVAASLFWKLASFLLLPGKLGSSFLGLAVSILLLWFGLDALRRKIPEPLFPSLGLLFACWPPLLLQVGKINNDVFLSLFSCLAVHQVWVWSRHRQTKHLLWSAAWCILGSFSKGNGALTTILIGWIVLMEPGPKDWPRWLKERAAFLIAGPLTLLALWLGSLRSASAHADGELLVGNIAEQAAGAQPSPYGWSQLLHLDPLAWFSAPHLVPGDLLSFWNTLGKGMIFGQYAFPLDPWTPLGYPLLLTLSAFLLAFLLSLRHWKRDAAAWIGGMALCLAALFAFRLHYPYQSSLDLRYTPLLVFFLLQGATKIKPSWLAIMARWFTLSTFIAYLSAFGGQISLN